MPGIGPTGGSHFNVMLVEVVLGSSAVTLAGGLGGAKRQKRADKTQVLSDLRIKFVALKSRERSVRAKIGFY